MDILTVGEYCAIRDVWMSSVSNTLRKGKLPVGVNLALKTKGMGKKAGITILFVDSADNLPLGRKCERNKGNPNFHLYAPKFKAKQARLIAEQGQDNQNFSG